NRAFWGSHEKVNPRENRTHYRKILQQSDLITVSTPYLAERLERFGRTVVIRNAIDLERFSWGAEEEPLTVGWVGATAWRSGDLETLQGVIGPFIRQHGMKFIHSGHAPNVQTAAEALGLQEEEVIKRPMASIHDYPNLFGGITIGVVPLRLTAFNYSKSAIKGMEYAASGIPFVAAHTPEYEWFGAPTARQPRDWRRELERLLDPGERARDSFVNFERVQEEDISRRASDWLNAYSQVVRIKEEAPL